MLVGTDLLRQLLVGRFAHQQTGHRIYKPGKKSATDSISSIHRFHLILSGQLSYTVEGQTITLNAGEQSFATAWIRRRWMVPGPEPCEIIFYGFDTDKSMLVTPSLYRRTLSPEAFRTEREMFARLHEPHNDYFEEQDQVWVEGEIKGSLARFFREAVRCAPDLAAEAANALHPQVQQAQALLLKHLADPHALQRVYKEIRITPGYLRKLFHAGTGDTLGAFLLRMKMQRARFLLQTTHDSVKEIATQVGFNDPLHFSRRYAAYWKVPPSLDRKSRDTV